MNIEFGDPVATEYFELVFGSIDETPNAYAPAHFNTAEQARQYCIVNYRNRNKEDGYDEHYHTAPMYIQKITKTVQKIII